MLLRQVFGAEYAGATLPLAVLCAAVSRHRLRRHPRHGACCTTGHLA